MDYKTEVQKDLDQLIAWIDFPSSNLSEYVREKLSYAGESGQEESISLHWMEQISAKVRLRMLNADEIKKCLDFYLTERQFHLLLIEKHLVIRTIQKSALALKAVYKYMEAYAGKSPSKGHGNKGFKRLILLALAVEDKNVRAHLLYLLSRQIVPDFWTNGGAAMIVDSSAKTEAWLRAELSTRDTNDSRRISFLRIIYQKYVSK